MLVRGRLVLVLHGHVFRGHVFVVTCSWSRVRGHVFVVNGGHVLVVMAGAGAARGALLAGRHDARQHTRTRPPPGGGGRGSGRHQVREGEAAAATR